MRLLLIDNYDSFTFNLVQYFKELDCDVSVFRNNQVTLQQIKETQYDLIVLSPGPCSPNEAGICLSIVEHFAGNIPLLGVCLGHQVIAQSFGAEIVRAKKVMHGKVSTIRHNCHDMFDSIPEKFSVTRYHSLIVRADNLPGDLQITAVSGNSMQDKNDDEREDECEVMAIAHRKLPIWGVQFHPESHLTAYGHSLLNNIVRLSVNR